MSVKHITPSDFAKRTQKGDVVLLDVRTDMEYQQVHADCAVHEPLSQLDPSVAANRHGLDKHKPVYVICKSGGRSMAGAQKFDKAGFVHVYSIDGGTNAWVRAGLPVVRTGCGAFSLLQQVLFVSALLIICGGILDNYLHTRWFMTGACVVLMLMFLGVTGKCNLATLLAKMPWNKTQGCGKKGACCSVDSKDAYKSCKCGE